MDTLPRKLLTVAQAAAILGIGRSLAYMLVSTGKIRSFKIGRSRRIPLSALDDFIETQLADQSEGDAG
jgi:excisionase family DNA binding protein